MGRRLQLINCQNLFCEVDKYARIVHPEYKGESGQSKLNKVLSEPGPAASMVSAEVETYIFCYLGVLFSPCNSTTYGVQSLTLEPKKRRAGCVKGIKRRAAQCLSRGPKENDKPDEEMTGFKIFLSIFFFLMAIAVIAQLAKANSPNARNRKRLSKSSVSLLHLQ